MGCLGQFTLPCETTRASNTDCVPISPTLSGGFNFIDPVQNSSYLCILEDIMQNQIDLFGVNVGYMVYDFALSANPGIYGELPTAPYKNPVEMKMLVKYLSDTVALQAYGIVCEAQVEAIIGVQQFKDAIGDDSAEPKSGDILRFSFLDDLRPNGRGYTQWEVSKRTDESFDGVAGLNPNLIHKFWYLRAIRKEFNSEQNMAMEPLNDQVYDSLSAGTINFTSEDPTDPNNALISALKKFGKSADELAKEEFNHTTYNNNTNPYGDY
jgi:hypothetical protein